MTQEKWNICCSGPIKGRRLIGNLEEENRVDLSLQVTYLETQEEYGCGNHCCYQMNFHINEEERIIVYFPQLREYDFRVGEHLLQGIEHCPWCGTALPLSLRRKFFDLLEEREINLNIIETSDLPVEFQSEEWWIKRGL